LIQAETYLTRNWNENVLHVYPYTFNEERPDGVKHIGVGSILGITKKLDWAQESGITALWLGPIYESPMLDGNYDITNYREINPLLGTMADVEELIREAHNRDIRIIFDLVPNHTSDQSEWFKISCDRTHELFDTYENYYIWHDAVEDTLPEGIVGADRLKDLPDGFTVPNNWTSIFSLPQIDEFKKKHPDAIPGPDDIPAVTAWVWNKQRGQFYLAEFMKGQPSLNWNHPPVREEIKDVVRFWLDRGVDSFRVDVMNHIGKDPDFENEELAPVGTAIGEYNPGISNPHDKWKQQRLVSHWPQLGNYANELVSVLDEPKYRDKNIRFIFEDWMSALDKDGRLDNLRPDRANVFNFEMLLNTNRLRWTARNIGRIISSYYTRLPRRAVPNQVSGNHDTKTLMERLLSQATARAAYLVLAMLPGALYTWQSDMLLRADVDIAEERQRDGKSGKRDGGRAPIPWNWSRNGGFSDADPEALWLPTVPRNVYESDNIETQARDPRSPYRLVKEILRRRKNDPTIHEGSLRMLRTDHPDVLAFARIHPKNPRRQVISITNFSQDTVSVSILGAYQGVRGRITLSASKGPGQEQFEIDFDRPIILPPDESYLIDSDAA
jgi:alpha-glucosidase